MKELWTGDKEVVNDSGTLAGDGEVLKGDG